MVCKIGILCLFLGVAFNTCQGKPQQNFDDNYQYDDASEYSYDDENIVREEEQEIGFDPKFVTKSSTYTVDKGTTIRLPCYVDKFPENFVIMWRKASSNEGQSNNYLVLGSKVMKDSHRISVEINHKGTSNLGSTLVIGLADDSDAGQYVCVLGTNEQKELKHTVSVRDPPTIKKEPKNGFVKARKGDDVSMSCEGKGSPQPSITWSRMGKRLPDGRQSLKGNEISFRKVNRHHSGVYKCVANNGYGQEASDKIELSVEFAPEVEAEKMFIHATENSQVELVCSVHAHPHATVKWFKNSIELTDEDVTLEKIAHRHILTIPALTHSDYGNYTCRAKNTLGEASRILEVSGLAGFADFKTSPRGSEPHSFLLEWTSQSQNQIDGFELMWRQVGGEWQYLEVDSHQQSSFLWAGKHSFSGLQEAARYEAKVAAENQEGWSRPSPTFHFATFGAEPLTEANNANCISARSHTTIAVVVLLLANLFH